MDKIKWLDIEGDKVAMRKSWDGWRVVYPYKNEDGSYNKKNIIGSWPRWVKSLAILLIILVVYWIYAHDTDICRETVQRNQEWWLNFSYNTPKKSESLAIPDMSNILANLNNITQQEDG